MFIIIGLKEWAFNLLITSVADDSLACHSSHILNFFLLLLFSSLLKNCIQFLLSKAELLFNLSVSANCSLDPFMRSNFLNFWSLLWVKGNHSSE